MMPGEVDVFKDEQAAQPVPSKWRATLHDIVEAFKLDDMNLLSGLTDVMPLSPEVADRIRRNLDAYGAKLSSLPDQSWETSTCQWQLNYWEVLVDLFVDAEASDLALFVKVIEMPHGYRYEIKSIHVP